jgi:predicted GNAT family acetyltransferase
MTNSFENLQPKSVAEPVVESGVDPGIGKSSADKQHHYNLIVDERRVGFIEYSLYGQVAIVTHTEVDPQCEGRGYGSELARQAAAFFRSQGWQVVPVCGFFARYLRTHPDDAVLVTPASRRIFQI